MLVKDSIPDSDKSSIVQPLLQWFKKTSRDLPWRRTYNPYHVWISEIMLQQTQMSRGVAYFQRWVERFPDVHSVAVADENEILKYWEGLGYYSRARNLHKAATIIATDFFGEVPCDYEQLLTLPGIGPYTAAAVASVAGNRDIPVVDANVARVFARLFDIGEPVKSKQVQNLVHALAVMLLPSGKARLFNQALMDLGGLVCTPKCPDCEACPISSSCKALQAGTTLVRPVVVRGKKIITQQKIAGIIVWNGQVFIQQRKVEDVWGGLWEFPGGDLGEGEIGNALIASISGQTGLLVEVVEPITTVVHHYTHHKIILQCFLCVLKSGNDKVKLTSANNYSWVHPEELQNYAFPAGPRKILEYMGTNLPEFFV